MPLSPSALEPLLALSLVQGIGPHRVALLIHRFGSAERALEAPIRELETLPGFGSGLARRVREAAGSPTAAERLRRALAALERSAAVAMTPDDLAYPATFRQLADPPYLLYASGELGLLERRGVAVVGTRAPTEYGRAAATAFGAGLARAGFSVVSGMARGIDTLAHRAALAAGGASIGVLGHGIDQTYPPENGELFAEMRRSGLLITEFPPGERPLAGNFPRRNRLIAALSQAVLVVEMGMKSGAQHTVGYALDLGREVLAVPGPIGATTSMGTNQLIRDGGRMVTTLDEVLEELDGVGYGESRRPGPTRPAPVRPDLVLPLLTGDESRVMEALGSRASRHVDELIDGASLAPGRLLPLLLEMELKGLIDALPGKLFRRA